MLYLKRMIYPGEVKKCDASGKIMMYGDFYYEDDETGKCIEASYYNQLKMDRRKNNWPYTEVLEEAQNQREYEEQLKEAEQAALANEVLDMPMYGEDSDNNDREVGKYKAL